MTTVYYDQDVKTDALQGKKIAVVGLWITRSRACTKLKRQWI
ncbi:2-dehydropantoate 2-reductase [Staphylococcus aureus]|nr:2-dehydropantoate 2-reductase [Staphylococcus aureus]